MTLLKKVKLQWEPVEKRDLQLGEIFDFPGPYEGLVKSGMAILVDESGNELELPNQHFTCPVCFEDLIGLRVFSSHVNDHLSKVPEKPTIVKEEKPVSPGEELKKAVEEELEKQNSEEKPTIEDDQKAKKAEEFKKRMAEGRAKKAAEKAAKSEKA